MVWTEPRTWNVGDMATAADFNTYVRDNAKIGYHKPFAYLFKNGNQTIPNQTHTYVNFDYLPAFSFGPWDNYGQVNLSGGTTDRINIVYSGFYHLWGYAGWATGNQANARSIGIYNSTGLQLGRMTCRAMGGNEMTVDTYYYLPAGDYVRLDVYHSDGAGFGASSLDVQSPSLAIAFHAN